MNYQLIVGLDGKTVLDNVVMRLPDMACIPFDEANRDYQKYLEWLAEGNTPLPPNAPTVETK